MYSFHSWFSACLLAVLVSISPAGPRATAQVGGTMTSDASEQPQSRLNVVWTSADPEVAENVCFMYTLNAKRQGWFDVVHLVVWGPSSKLLAEDEKLQSLLRTMQEAGVVTEACLACADRYGVTERLTALGIDVKYMGVPLSDRLKGDWKTITF